MKKKKKRKEKEKYGNYLLGSPLFFFCLSFRLRKRPNLTVELDSSAFFAQRIVHAVMVTRLPASTSVLGGLGLNAFVVRKHFNGTGGTGVLELCCLEGLMSHFIHSPVQFIFLKKVFYRLEDLGDQGERKERQVKLKQLKGNQPLVKADNGCTDSPTKNNGSCRLIIS